MISDKIGIELLQACHYTAKAKKYKANNNFINTTLFKVIQKEQEKLSKKYTMSKVSELKVVIEKISNVDNSGISAYNLTQKLQFQIQSIEKILEKVVIEHEFYKNVLKELIDKESIAKDKMNSLIANNSNKIIELDAKIEEQNSIIETERANYIRDSSATNNKYQRLLARNNNVFSNLASMKAKALVSALKYKINYICLEMKLESNKEKL